MLFDLLLIILFGWAAGLIVGLAPGIGASTLILSLYPLLQNFDITEIFIFYIILITSCQYYGQISAILYGVPGEVTALPAVQYGHPVHLKGRGAELLSATASASLLGSIVGMIFFYIISNNLNLLLMFFDNTFKTIYLTIAILIIIVFTENKILSIFLAICGFLIGLVGYNGLTAAHFFVPAASIADAGIPFGPMFLGFFILPTLIFYWKETARQPINILQLKQLSLRQRTTNLMLIKNSNSIVRGSVLGSIIGLIPGASYAISSSIAATLEYKLQKTKQKIERSFCSVVSAESANNAGSITVLVPLIFLALPIIPSEAIIFSLAEQKGFGFAVSFDFVKEKVPLFLFIIAIFNIINWVLAGYYYTLIGLVYVYIKNAIYPVMITGLTAMFSYIAWYNNQLLFSAAIFAVSFLIGMIIKSTSAKIVFIFLFFLADVIFSEYYRFYLLNF